MDELLKALPAKIRGAVLAELARGPIVAGRATAEYTALSMLWLPAALVTKWGAKTPQHVASANARINRISRALSRGDAARFHSWKDKLAADELAAFYRALVG